MVYGVWYMIRRIQPKWWQQVRPRPHLPHAPRAKMTRVNTHYLPMRKRTATYAQARWASLISQWSPIDSAWNFSHSDATRVHKKKI